MINMRELSGQGNVPYEKKGNYIQMKNTGKISSSTHNVTDPWYR